MSNESSEETRPNQISDETIPVQVNAPPAEKQPKKKRWPWILCGFLLVILLTAGGAYFGYRSAVQMRMQQMANDIALMATTQFQLGLQDIDAGRYQAARQRFEYVIQIDPKFPGVAEKLSEVMLKMASITTPTPDITPTVAPTPTVDNRPKEELWNSAIQFARAKDWESTIATLDAMRKQDIAFRPLDVDGLYYIALRYRGIDKIVLNGNLEGGIYDLALMERFGPMDKEADAFRNWARFYLTGASFWEIDWPKVLEYFSQIYASLPNLRDGSGWTAAERFRIASIKYGDKLAAGEDFCGARDQYRNALNIAQDDKLAPTATKVQLICQPPTATSEPLTPTVPVVATTPPPVITPPVDTVAPTNTPEATTPPVDTPPVETTSP